MDGSDNGRAGAGRLVRRIALTVGVLGGAGWAGSDLLRSVAFRGLGTAGAVDYVLANRSLGVAAALVTVGMIAAAAALRRELGRVASLSGWIAVAGLAMLAGGSLGEFVFFTQDRYGLAAASWLWFVIGLPVTAIGLTGVGLKLFARWAEWRRLVASWLAASVPLMFAGFVLGLLGTPLALGVMGLCVVLLRERSPEH
jgi:hypothetical protein